MDFLQQQQQEEEEKNQPLSFINVIQTFNERTQNHIYNHICSFLTKRDIFLLKIASKQIKRILEEEEEEQKQQQFDNWLQKQFQHKKKNNKNDKNAPMKIIETQFNKILKLNIFKLPNQLLQKNEWVLLEQNDKIISQKVREDKFITEHQNLFFLNKNNGVIMFINRSLIDKKLNFNENTWGNEEEQSNQIKYKDLIDGKEFSDQNYDFSSMESMKKRQSDIQNYFEKQKKQQQIDSLPENCLDELYHSNKITIILCYGGYFSIAIYHKGNCVLHKSDHKYVVRKKGGGQREITSGKVRGSTGSQMRRANEEKHQENVQTIISENLQEIQKSDLVFLQAPGINKLILVREDQPLWQVKSKLRSICMTSKKANYTEIDRIYKAITKVYFVKQK